MKNFLSCQLFPQLLVSCCSQSYTPSVSSDPCLQLGLGFADVLYSAVWPDAGNAVDNVVGVAENFGIHHCSTMLNMSNILNLQVKGPAQIRYYTQFTAQDLNKNI